MTGPDAIALCLPSHLPGGQPIEVRPGNPEFGAIEIIVWRDERRDDGMSGHFADAGAAVRFVRNMIAKMQAGELQ